MPRPKQVSDEQITSAARKVFMEVGVSAPVSLVAKALGVTPAALFHRTGSKEQLFVMAMRHIDPRQFKILQLLKDGPAENVPVREQLIEILTRLSAHLAIVSPNLFLMVAAGMLKPGAPRGALPKKTRRNLTGWLLRAQRLNGLHFNNAEVVADALVGALEARHLYGYLEERQTSVPEEQRYVIRLIDGLLGAPRG